MFEDSTINGAWLKQQGPIQLRQGPRRDERKINAQAVEGIMLAGLIGASTMVWTYVLVKLFWS